MYFKVISRLWRYYIVVKYNYMVTYYDILSYIIQVQCHVLVLPTCKLGNHNIAMSTTLCSQARIPYIVKGHAICDVLLFVIE